MTCSALTRWNGVLVFFGFLPSPLFFPLPLPLGWGVVSSLEPCAGALFTATAVGTDAPSSPVLRFLVTETSSLAASVFVAAVLDFFAFGGSSSDDESESESSSSDSSELDEESDASFFLFFDLGAGSDLESESESDESESSESDESEESDELEDESESFAFLDDFLDDFVAGLPFAFLSSSSLLSSDESSDSELVSSSSLESVLDDGGEGVFAFSGLDGAALLLTAIGFASLATFDSA